MIRVARVGMMLAGVAMIGMGRGARGVEIDAAKLPVAVARKIEFSEDVLPILKGSCVKCHGEVRQKGKLRLDSRAAALKGGEEGAVIAAGDSAHSDLIARVAGMDEERVMAPKGARLEAEQVGSLRALSEQRG